MTFSNPDTVEPSDLKPDDKLCYIVVAVVGYADDWTAYVGLADSTPEHVASNGNKLDRAAAERLFPVCVNAGLKWRY